MNRSATRAAVAVAWLLVSAAPAWAHEEISPSSVATGKPAFLVLSAANEKTADLTKIVLSAPAGMPLGGTTREPSGWTATKAASTVTWTAGPGTGSKPDHFEQWGFETEGADQPGTFSFKVALTYADGKTEEAEVPVSAGASGTATTVAGSMATTAATTASSSPTITTAPGEAPSEDRANVAIGIGAAALALAVIALALGRRRSASPAPEGPAGPEPGGTTDAQSW